jgi:hypothetical protein
MARHTSVPLTSKVQGTTPLWSLEADITHYKHRGTSPDVICPDLPDFHFEVKAVERLNINEAMAQAVDDAGEKTPVVAHKRNRGDWLVTMRASD